MIYTKKLLLDTAEKMLENWNECHKMPDWDFFKTFCDEWHVYKNYKKLESYRLEFIKDFLNDHFVTDDEEKSEETILDHVTEWADNNTPIYYHKIFACLSNDEVIEKMEDVMLE
jgi:hypothetical protein